MTAIHPTGAFGQSVASTGKIRSRIRTLYTGERQLQTGPGEDPPSQQSIPGMEPDLPTLSNLNFQTRPIHSATKKF
jgi:hypothetical protein